MLDLDDFTVDEIELVLTTTDAMKEVLARDVPRVPALARHDRRHAVLRDQHAHARRRSSWPARCSGADVINVAAAAAASTKGESLIDTVRTLQALGADFLVMRHRAAARRTSRRANIRAA